MVTISLAMIVKNEEKVIDRCLNSVISIMDEIIIVDTGSTDRTKEICGRYTDKIYDFNWIDDFSMARNYSYRHATKDYIMWLDADDIIMPDSIVALNKLKNELSNNIDVVMMKYATGMDSKGSINFSYFRERLTRRDKNFMWLEPVHEYIQTFGNLMTSEITIIHAKLATSDKNVGRNIQIYERILEKGNLLSPRGNYYYARELKDNMQYEKSVEQFQLFLNSKLGWVEDNICACSELGKCYILLEQPDKALESFYNSFTYDLPRAEICCQIGYLYQSKEEYRQAVFWFELILHLNKPLNNYGFCHHDCWDYIPLIECAVCYDKLKDYEKATFFNEKALDIKPDSVSALSNRIYFNEKIKRINEKIIV